jgi:hypothetical protein
MFPAMANINFRELYDSTVEFLALRSPTVSGSDRALSPTSPVRDSWFPSDWDNTPELTSRPQYVHSYVREHAAPDGRDTRFGRSPSIPGMTLASMKRELDDTRKELTKTKLEVTRLRERCKQLEMALRETQSMLMVRDSGHVTPEQREVGWDEVSHDDPGDRHPISSAREEEAEHRITTVFMTKTDSWSGAQVVQAVQDLNSEIVQFSAAVSELCSFEPRQQTSRYSQAVQDTSARLGKNVANILASRDHSQDPILVQLAIQGAVTSCMARSMSSFCMGLPSKHDGILGQIYSHMYAAGSSMSSFPASK